MVGSRDQTENEEAAKLSASISLLHRQNEEQSKIIRSQENLLKFKQDREDKERQLKSLQQKIKLLEVKEAELERNKSEASKSVFS